MVKPNEAEAAELDDTPLAPTEAMRLARRFAGWLEPLTALDRAVGRVYETATKSVVTHKTRAETSAKLAEAKGIDTAIKIVQIARQIVADLADSDLVAAYEMALAREIYGPLRLEPPAVTTHPMEL